MKEKALSLQKIDGMNSFEQHRLKAMVLHILNVTGGIDFYHVFKILYFAEREHLAKWGHRMIADDFCALDYGPVPSQLYNAIKVLDNPNSNLASELQVSMKFAGADAPNVMIAKEPADMDYISASEKEALDKSIMENASLTFKQLKEKSHDIAWQEAFSRKRSSKLSLVKMAEAVHADTATLEYIKEQMELEDILA